MVREYGFCVCFQLSCVVCFAVLLWVFYLLLVAIVVEQDIQFVGVYLKFGEAIDTLKYQLLSTSTGDFCERISSFWALLDYSEQFFSPPNPP